MGTELKEHTDGYHSGLKEDRSGARRAPCTVLNEEGTLWRESRSSVAGDAVKRGLAPETQVGLSGYSATIKLCDDSGWRLCVTSDAAPALSPESTFFIEYCAGGPSSATPVLLSCVASFDTAPPPQDLLAGLLYTAPPPSTGDGSFDSYLSSP
ncbi:uncharacterized protein UHOD_11420 [Ustilago sp. UG-2017b]|nr:uncharacterized protein UHOD_11420 [Ustilago sp. UG-2017b]